MTNFKDQNSNTGVGRPRFDLEQRAELFARRVRALVRVLPRTVSNREDIKQLVRASGSVAANYIEANDALGKKDFMMKIKLARREAKESRLFLSLVDTADNDSVEDERAALVQEARELVNILSKIAQNVT